jgi:hypothetical protein
MYYRARYYHPALGRFVSADTVVPEAASGAGGGLGTIGYGERTRLTPLTVAFHEASFIGVVGAENRELMQFGWFFQWGREVRREHPVPAGPLNPQALNRYAYVLNNPLRYVDPTGHYLIDYFDVELTVGQTEDLLRELDSWLDVAESFDDFAKLADILGWTAEAMGVLGLTAPEVSVPAGGLLIAAGLTLDWTVGDLNTLRYEMAMAAGRTKSGEYTSCARGVHLRMGSNLINWGIELNQQEIIAHWNVNPVLTPKGMWNGTRGFMTAWFLFDYDYGLFAPFGPLASLGK